MIEDLKRGALFARLTSEQIERVAARASRVSLRDGQALFEQGDSAVCALSQDALQSTFRYPCPRLGKGG